MNRDKERESFMSKNEFEKIISPEDFDKLTLEQCELIYSYLLARLYGRKEPYLKLSAIRDALDTIEILDKMIFNFKKKSSAHAKAHMFGLLRGSMAFFMEKRVGRGNPWTLRNADAFRLGVSAVSLITAIDQKKAAAAESGEVPTRQAEDSLK